MDDDRREQLKAKILRGLVVAMTILGLVAIVLCFVPSVQVYKDAHDCANEALGRALSWHNSNHHRCEPSWVLAETRGPVDHQVGMALYFLAVIAPGLLVRKWPTLKLAMLWAFLTFGATFLMIVATFELFGNWDEHLVQLPLSYVFGLAASTLVITLIALVPVFCGVFAIATRKRPPPPPVFPTARIVER